MQVMVCTGFSKSGRAQYGEDFLRTFHLNWPDEVRLGVWVEEAMAMPRGACRDLWAIPGAREFHARHKDDPFVSGRKQIPGTRWKSNALAIGYNFRWDALKFWKQLLIPQAAAAELQDGDVLVWLDADVVTRGPVALDFVPKLLGGADVCFLGRDGTHSEIGFYAVRLSPLTRLFLARVAEIYTSDGFKDLAENHSAFVFDHVRKQMDLREHNLTPRGRGHVWLKSPLYPLLDHLKGDARKKMGRSR